MEIREHYLDNSATTPVLPEAAEKAARIMTQEYGNPSSLHTRGFRAKQELEIARELVAGKLGARADEIFFTSGGTEGNNLAILGAAEAKKRAGNKIVTTMAEHESVLSPMRELEKRGFEVVYLKPDSFGNISAEELYDTIDEKTILVSVMCVNNETGALFPVHEAARAIKRKKAPALLHSDCVQALSKLDFTPQKLGLDLCTVSAHKVHGPKGVGALYVKKGVRILPLVFGGGQEKGLRAGTESLPLICAFSEALRHAPKPSQALSEVKKLNLLLRTELQRLPDVTINSPENGLPYILNFSAGRVRAETMLHFLAEKGVYLSSGSACSRAKPSHVLEAMGLSNERINSSLRASLSRFTEEEDILALTKALKQGLSSLAS